MAFYDLLLDSLREIKGNIKENPLTNTSVSGAIAGELTIILVALLATLLFARINKLLALFLGIICAGVILTNLPLVPKLIKEQNNSLKSMLFYVILTLGIMICLIYWGVKYV